MRYGQIRNLDVANGEGIRVTLFVTGCHFDCYECFNKEYQDFNFGKRYTIETREQLIKELQKPHISGLSLLGGEPMEHAKLLAKEVKEIKKHMREDQTIWLWSGYTLKQIQTDPDKIELLEQLDVLVDGQFRNELKDLNLKFRGSSNQRIIDVKETLQTKSIKLLDK